MSQNKISIIIPCYNSEKFIRKTIDSVLGQRYRDFEILIIDDGSTDKTRNILESYLPDIKILTHPNNSNLGVGASMNPKKRKTSYLALPLKGVRLES